MAVIDDLGTSPVMAATDNGRAAKLPIQTREKVHRFPALSWLLNAADAWIVAAMCGTELRA